MPSENDRNRQHVEGGETAPEVKLGRGTRTAIYAVGGGFVLFLMGVLVFETDLLYRERASHSPSGESKRQQTAIFVPPLESAIPQGPEGEAIRRGLQIFTNTQTNAREFVGNGLSCTNCHLNGGREPNSAPMWAAWVQYPKYRSKNKKINTIEDRVNGCFSYSMNAQGSPSGGPPPRGHDTYKDLETYFHWLATNAPTGIDMDGSGFPKMKVSALGYDPDRGRAVFDQNCITCHGADGQGKKDLNGRHIFPPLWGPDSFNWGAGMARIDAAAGFIRANMPFGKPNLSDQQAWDAAAFINSHERPKDPRQTGTIAEAAAQYHAGEETFYGKQVGVQLLGQGTASVTAPTPVPASAGRP